MKVSLIIVVLVLGFHSKSQEWVPLGGGANNDVRDIFADTTNNRLYAVGSFQDIGGTGAHRVAYWDGSNWTSMCGVPFIMDNNPIVAVTVYNDELYVTGSHGIMEDSITGRFAHFNSGTGTWEKFTDIDGYADIEVLDGKLFTYCCFDSIGGKDLKNIATWDGATWEPLGDTSVSNYFNTSFIKVMEKYNNNYIFAGNSQQPKEIFEWDGISWSELGNGIPGNSWVNCMKTYQGILYIGGSFDSPGFPKNVVAWDGQQFFDPFPDVNYVAQVSDMEVINNELYIVGPIEFNTPNETYGFAKFDGDTLCVFGGAGIWGTLYDIPVAYDIEEFNGDLIVRSNLAMLYDTVNYIAKWNGSGMQECMYSPVHLGVTTIQTQSFELYPNPSSGEVSISLPSGTIADEIEVRDLLGRLVSIVAFKNTIELDVPNGIYFIGLLNKGRVLGVERWVKE